MICLHVFICIHIYVNILLSLQKHVTVILIHMFSFSFRNFTIKLHWLKSASHLYTQQNDAVTTIN